MTDRLKGCVVVFDKDYRDDDAADIISALTMVKGVASVSPVVANHEDYMNRERVRLEYQRAILDALQGMREGKI